MATTKSSKARNIENLKNRTSNSTPRPNSRKRNGATATAAPAQEVTKQDGTNVEQAVSHVADAIIEKAEEKAIESVGGTGTSEASTPAKAKREKKQRPEPNQKFRTIASEETKTDDKGRTIYVDTLDKCGHTNEYRKPAPSNWRRCPQCEGASATSKAA